MRGFLRDGISDDYEGYRHKGREYEDLARRQTPSSRTAAPTWTPWSPNPADSVRRPCRGTLVDRLFVGDNSAFANCLGGTNPTLTNQAIATRTAERIFSKLLRRRSVGWGSESPVVSTDEHVTQGSAAL